MKIVFTILLCTFSFRMCACINEYRTLLNGQVVYTDAMSGIPYYKVLDTLKLKKELLELEMKYKVDHSYETLSDYAVILIYLGRWDESLEIFHGIEKNRPDLYATAANMGTIHELKGNFDSAIYYIQKAIQINPASHESSEWIHIKILEAKRLLKKGLSGTDNLNILGLNFGQDIMPFNTDKLNLAEIEAQIRFQLGERMTFVKPKDIIVGQLLFDLGNISAIIHDLETSLELYALAKEFGYSSDLMEKRMQKFSSMTLKASLANIPDEKSRSYPQAIVFILTLAGMGILWLIYKGAKRRKASHKARG
jgi:tetratricopeptide (TPR) repeat protein